MTEDIRRDRLAKAVAITMHSVVHPLSEIEEVREAITFQQQLNVFDAIVVHSPLQGGTNYKHKA